MNIQQWLELDRRPGYARQEQEKRDAITTCECGARVVENLKGELIHIGSCSIIDTGSSKG